MKKVFHVLKVILESIAEGRARAYESRLRRSGYTRI
jgi:hypothetical protein